MKHQQLTPFSRLGLSIILGLLLTLIAFSTIHAQEPGDLDPTFNNSGIVTTSVGSSSVGNSVAIQPDGRIVVAGQGLYADQQSFAVVRYTITGSLDKTFNNTGIVTTSTGNDFEEGLTVALQPDGKIVVAGYSYDYSDRNIMLVRYNEDGSLDESFDGDFNGNGIVTTSITGTYAEGNCVVIQPNDGKIVVAANNWRDDGVNDIHYFTVVRYNSDGTLDTDFGGTGIVTHSLGGASSQAYGVALQPDGKIVVAGTTDANYTDGQFAIVRYTVTGTLDLTFDGTGIVTTPIGQSSGAGPLAILRDGKIVVAGSTDSGGGDIDFAIARYTITGSLDTTFNGTGIVTTSIGNGDYAQSLAIQPNKKIVVAGYSYNTPTIDDRFTLVRYNSDGSLDTTFNNTGVVTTAINERALGNSVAIQTDGKLVVAGASGVGGDFDFTVARYFGVRYAYLPLILKN